MKTNKFIYAGLAALSMASSSAFAAFYEHNVTLSLAGSIEGPQTYKESHNSNKSTYEYKSKFITAKYSNKEFLQSLVYDEVISSISGWSLKYVLDEEGEPVGLYIVKKNTSPINVSYYAGFDTEQVVEEYTEKDVYSSNGDEEEGGTWTERGFGYVWLNVPDLQIELYGSYAIAGEWKWFYDYSEDTETYSEKVKSGSFDDLVGSIGEGSNETAPRDVVLDSYHTAIVGGYVTLGSGAKVTTNYYSVN